MPHQDPVAQRLDQLDELGLLRVTLTHKQPQPLRQRLRRWHRQQARLTPWPPLQERQIGGQQMRFRLQVRQPALCVGGAALLQGSRPSCSSSFQSRGCCRTTTKSAKISRIPIDLR